MFSHKHTLGKVLVQNSLQVVLTKTLTFFSICWPEIGQKLKSLKEMIWSMWSFFMNVFWHFFTHTCIKNSADIDQ